MDDSGNLKPPASREMVCYNCQGVADPADCYQAARCSKGEVCETHEDITDNGSMSFDMGCLSRQACEAIGHHLPFGRRHVVKRYELCRGCCDKRDNCNSEFCSMKKGITNMTAIDHLVVTPSHLTALLGSRVKYICKFDPQTNETMSMTWTFTDLFGNVTHIYTHDVQPPALKFYVKSVETSDSGTYTCEARLGSWSWSASGNLTVVAASLDIIQGPKTQTVQEGRRVTFSCVVSGNPTPSTTWQFVNGTTTSNIINGVTTTPTGSQMVIDAVSRGDAGIYKCLSSNILGTKESLAVLTVEDIPTIVLAPQDQQVHLQDVVGLKCEATGTPTATVHWIFSSLEQLRSLSE
ncbi:roundabout homolog 3-like [Haliotis rubra]|uniref:roundabout homolog 3-like n=1 Tax=Haliotis rubra TaxID=36100 RepID=UPI001EE4FE81|nr:roundabout homolog 3-like [Haliotis rubra]